MRQTPLTEELAAIGGKIVDFHGWALPVQFAGIVREHEHTRTAVSIFDCSHMGEFEITGAEAVAAHDRLVISDIAKLKPGRARYGAFLNDDGGIIDDVITMKLDDDRLFVVTNAGPLEQVAAMLTAIGPGVRNVSDGTAKIDVQGPRARNLLVEAGYPLAGELNYFGMGATEWDGAPVILSRTGYTGELGFEIYLPNEKAVPLWRELGAIDGVKPAGLGARDTLRTEMGYPLSGQDVDETRTPLEAGMDFFVAWDSAFRGKEALVRQRDAGDYAVLTPIRTADRRAPRHDFEVKADGAVVGRVTSGTFGPSVGHGVGLAYLSQDCASPGTALTAGPRDLPIEVAEIPFYKQGTCRN
jgi:glycine cleavage system T protein (aminomethyltransferase)